MLVTLLVKGRLATVSPQVLAVPETILVLVPTLALLRPVP
jgi:hypothetical protein